ncbi:MAG: hypothetical protein N3F64_06625 [Nitrososphaeria archaeon]|nr:hypothetical protein [Nitrososphaeria archaeon]
MSINNLKPLASFIILAYIVIRIVWEVGTFDITMSPNYCLLNLLVLMPLLLLLLYSIVSGRFGKYVLRTLSILSIVYVGGYFFLGFTLYPLLLIPRLQPKSLFIDMFTISIITFTLIYTIWLQLKELNR